MRADLDTTKLTEEIFVLVDRLREDFRGSDMRVGTIGLIVELNGPLPEGQGEGEYTSIRYKCSDDRVWVQSGLVGAAYRLINSIEGDVELDE